MVGGTFTTFDGSPQLRLVRLNSDGTKDESFNLKEGFDGEVKAIFRQSSGKFLIGGDFQTYVNKFNPGIIQLDINGLKRDDEFDIGEGFNGTVFISKRQNDGKIILGGLFTEFNGITVNNLARLNVDGSLDNSFNIGTGFNLNVYDISLSPLGNIYAAGNFRQFNGEVAERIIRLNPDGSKDESFDTGTGFNNIT